MERVLVIIQHEGKIVISFDRELKIVAFPKEEAIKFAISILEVAGWNGKEEGRVA